MKKKGLWLIIAVFLMICAGESLWKTREAIKEAERRRTSADRQE